MCVFVFVTLEHGTQILRRNFEVLRIVFVTYVIVNIKTLFTTHVLR